MTLETTTGEHLATKRRQISKPKFSQKAKKSARKNEPSSAKSIAISIIMICIFAF